MQLKEGYKQTKIGIIPNEWETPELGELLKIRHGKSQKEVEDSNGKYPILGTGGLMGYANKFLYNKESVLIGRKGTINKPQYMSTPFWTVDTLFYSEISEKVVPKILYYNFLLIDWYSHNEASGVPSLNASKIEKIRIPFAPNLEEQQAIATALSEVDTLITNLDKLIAKKKAIKQGAMQQLLNSPTQGGKRLPGFDGEWMETTMGEVAKVGTGSKNTQDRVDGGKYPFFVRSQTIERINSYSFEGEGILTAGDGVGTGKVFHYVNEKIDIHQRVYLISDFKERVDGYFIFLIFREYFYDRIMSMTAKSSVDSVRKEMITEMEIQIPPTKEEQQSISEILKNIEEEIESLEQKKSKYIRIKQGMMQELLTGKTRLI